LGSHVRHRDEVRLHRQGGGTVRPLRPAVRQAVDEDRAVLGGDDLGVLSLQGEVQGEDVASRGGERMGAGLGVSRQSGLRGGDPRNRRSTVRVLRKSCLEILWLWC
jgi:hypothetical protein